MSDQAKPTQPSSSSTPKSAAKPTIPKASASTLRLWKSNRTVLTFGEHLAVEIFLELIEGEITEWTDESKMDVLASRAVQASEALIRALEKKREEDARSDGSSKTS